MSTRRLALVLGALLLLVLLAVGLFLFAFERVEVERQTPSSGEARRDAFLACRRFLTEMGIPTRTQRTLKELPPPGHLLLIANALPEFSPEDAARLLAWVDGGGYLLAPADGRLMEALGLELVEEDEEEPVEGAEPGVDDEDAEDLEIEIMAVRLASRPGVEHEVELWLDLRLAVAEEGVRPDFAAWTPKVEGLALVRFTRGAGWVTLFVDPRLFSNANLGRAEHASFLWSLVTAAGQPAAAALIHGVERPSLGSLIWKHGWAAVVSLSFLVGFWVWSRWVRFGPVLPEPPRERRSLLEHIRATADYLWRQEEVGRLVASSRQGLLKRAGARFPGFSQLPSQAKLERLASGSEVPAAEIGWALGSKVETEGKAKAAEMLRRLQILERVRRSL